MALAAIRVGQADCTSEDLSVLALKLTRPTAAIFALSVVAISATGCSSTRDQAAWTSLRGFTSSVRPAGFVAVAASNAVAVQRHAREHASAGVHTIETFHHQPARNL